MPGITESVVDEYMLSILPPRDSVMQEMEAEAAKRDIPIVGRRWAACFINMRG